MKRMTVAEALLTALLLAQGTNAAESATALSADEPRHFTPESGMESPKILKRVQPLYPENAKAKRIQGIVIVEATIDREGRVTDVAVLRGPRQLRQAAIDAASQWLFEPGTLDGEPVPIYLTLSIPFILGQEEAPVGEMERLLEGWRRKLADIDKRLADGKYGKAQEATNELIKKMLRRMGTGDSNTGLLGVAVLQRALSSAGLGEAEDACWYWHVAVGIHPMLAETELGPTGEKLTALLAAESVRLDAMQPSVEEPLLVHEQRLEVPDGARGFRLKGDVMLSANLTRAGAPVSPKVLARPAGPTLTYAALEAFRKYRYEPRIRDGQPLRSRVSTTIELR